MVNARVWRGLVRQRLWKTAAAGIAATVIGAGVTMSGPIAGATPTSAASAAATWLAAPAQLQTGSHFLTTFTPSHPASPGLTVAGVFAFAAAGASFNTDVKALTAWLDSATNIGGYIRTGTQYVGGALANVALAANAAHARGYSYSPTSFAGTNLITDLEGTENATGKFTGGYPTPTGQALAIIALQRNAPTYSGLPKAVTFLEHQVCTTSHPGHGLHGYPSTYTSCSSSTIGGDVDTTGAVSQALSYYATHSTNPTATTAATAAAAANTWLDAVKVTGGSLKFTWENYCQSPYTTLEPSVNSTALAIDGLVNDPTGPTYWGTDIAHGVNWLESAQDTTPGSTDGSLPACTASGVGNVRATTQGVQGLTKKAWTNLI
jgi:hypothetical protein